MNTAGRKLYALPVYLYFDAASDAEAGAMQTKIRGLLDHPLVQTQLRLAGVRERQVLIQAPKRAGG